MTVYLYERRLDCRLNTFRVRQLQADRKILIPSMLKGSEQRNYFVLAYILIVINKFSLRDASECQQIIGVISFQ